MRDYSERPSSVATNHLLIAVSAGRGVRAVEVSYRYAEADAQGDLVRGGVAVPLEDEGGRLGFLTVYTRLERALADEELRTLEEVAHRAGPAIENARRFREARQQ